jgi:hypothetical protein
MEGAFDGNKLKAAPSRPRHCEAHSAEAIYAGPPQHWIASLGKLPFGNFPSAMTGPGRLLGLKTRYEDKIYHQGEPRLARNTKE